MPRFQEEARKANEALVGQLGAIANEKGVTRAQIAIAWLLAQQPWIVPIPGTTKIGRLDENIGAADVDLSAEELALIQHAVEQVDIQGARYTAQQQAQIDE